MRISWSNLDAPNKGVQGYTKDLNSPARNYKWYKKWYENCHPSPGVLPNEHHPKPATRRPPLAQAHRLDYCISIQIKFSEIQMLTDDDGFGCLGVPIEEETLRQHCLLLELEVEEMHRQLAQARANIAKLVDINAEVSAGLRKARADLSHRLGQLSAANLELSQIKNAERSLGIFANAYRFAEDKES